MRALLDTSAFVRILRKGPLPRNLERLLGRAETELVVSIATAWEIAIKPQLGLSAIDIEIGIDALNAATLPILFSHIDQYQRLPSFPDHRDPFDRMLIAQALAENMAIVSSDSRFEDYKRLRVIWD